MDTREETRVRRRGAEHSPETVLMFLGLTVPLLHQLKNAQVRPRVPPAITTLSLVRVSFPLISYNHLLLLPFSTICSLTPLTVFFIKHRSSLFPPCLKLHGPFAHTSHRHGLASPTGAGPPGSRASHHPPSPSTHTAATSSHTVLSSPFREKQRVQLFICKTKAQ